MGTSSKRASVLFSLSAFFKKALVSEVTVAVSISKMPTISFRRKFLWFPACKNIGDKETPLLIFLIDFANRSFCDVIQLTGRMDRIAGGDNDLFILDAGKEVFAAVSVQLT